MRLSSLAALALCLTGPVQAFAPHGVPAAGTLQAVLCRGVLRPRAGVRGLQLGVRDDGREEKRRVIVKAAGVALLTGLARSDRRCERARCARVATV
jgi:hypothetical protein